MPVTAGPPESSMLSLSMTFINEDRRESSASDGSSRSDIIILFFATGFAYKYGKKQKCKSSGPLAIFSKSSIGTSIFFFSNGFFF